MRYEIKIRCIRLRTTMNDLRLEVVKRTGTKIAYTRFLDMVAGRLDSKACEEALAVADQILTEWENK